MPTPSPRALGILIAFAVIVCAPAIARTRAQDQRADTPTHTTDEAIAMQIHYLEIVTPDVDATCAALAAAHGVTFSDPIPELGAARTAPLETGGRFGVRAPLRDTETPVVRPYVLVDDLDAAVRAAEAAGAEIAIRTMELPGQGRIAIYLLGGNELGLWER